MTDVDALVKIVRKYDIDQFSWIDPAQIVTAQWVRMKCMFGCPSYGQMGCCPPNTPSVDDCRRFFREYNRAALFHFSDSLNESDTRASWNRRINTKLAKLEREVFLLDFPKAFVLFVGCCYLCRECAGDRQSCINKWLARPSPESMSVDVYATVRKLNYPIKVLSDFEQSMNRYSILLLD